MANKSAFIIPSLGFVLGLGIAYADTRPTWDDTGLTAVAVFVVAAILGAARPSTFWLSGLSVGFPILAMNVLLHSNFGSVIAVVVSLAGSAAGSLVGKLLGFNDAARATV